MKHNPTNPTVRRHTTLVSVLAAAVFAGSTAALAEGEDLASMLSRLNSLGTTAVTLIELVFFIGGLVLAGVNLAKVFGFSESRPGESKAKQVAAVIGGGMLATIATVIEMSTNTITG